MEGDGRPHSAAPYFAPLAHCATAQAAMSSLHDLRTIGRSLCSWTTRGIAQNRGIHDRAPFRAVLRMLSGI